MQDRFKFRFWHKPTNKMLDCYGFNEHCTFANTLDGIGTEYNPCATRDCELMQCTGLKDKNGKLIYEDDIVKIYDKFIDEIKFECGCFVLKKAMFHSEATYWPLHHMEVIGNKYENEELLNEIHS